MTNIIPTPVWQIIDQDGAPVVGASVYTYLPGTLTSKATYQDSGQTTQNTNPVVSGADGRTAALWGTGDYRVIVKDAAGVLIYDQVTRTGLPESAVSAAMLPVIGAATLAQARTLMGIDAEIQSSVTSIVSTLIAQEAGARAAADANLQSQISGVSNYLNAQVAALNTSIANLANNIQAQINALSSQIGSLSSGSGMFLQTGTSSTDTWGNLIVNYSPFAHALYKFEIIPTSIYDNFSFYPNWWNLGLGIFTPVSQTNGQAQGSAVFDPGTGLQTVPSAGFTWYAIGY